MLYFIVLSFDISRECQTNPRGLCWIVGCTHYDGPLIHADKTTKQISYAEWSVPSYGAFPDIDADSEPDPSDHSSNTLQLSETSDPDHVINMTHFQTNMTSLKVVAKNAISIF